MSLRALSLGIVALILLASQIMPASAATRDEGRAALEDAIQLAHHAAAIEAAALRVTPVPGPSVAHGSPSQAIDALLSALGTQTRPDAAALAAYDALPGPARAGLTATIDAFHALHLASAAAYDDETTRALLAASGSAASAAAVHAAVGLDLASILGARAAFLDTIPPLATALDTTPQNALPPPLVVESYLSIDLGTRDDHYWHPDGHLFLLDAGGDDKYETIVGTNFHRANDCHTAAATYEHQLSDPFIPLIYRMPAGAAIDLGGDDRYDPKPCGHYTLGAGFAGVGILIDADGDDSVLSAGPANWFGSRGPGYVSVGAGDLGGLGLFLDAAGDDAVVVGLASGGGGYRGGSGLYVDAAGDDERDGWLGSYGGSVGFPLAGVGIAVDAGGNDVTRTGGYGVGGAELGGIGVHIDLEGVDDYTGSSASLGCAAGGIGLLFDMGGENDVYRKDWWTTTYDETTPCGLGGFRYDSTHWSDTWFPMASILEFIHQIDLDPTPGPARPLDERELQRINDVRVPSQETPEQRVEDPGRSGVTTPDVPATGGAPVPDVPANGPTPLVPVKADVGTVRVSDGTAGGVPAICVDVDFRGAGAYNVACVDRRLLGGADALVPRTEIPIRYENTPTIPATPGATTPDVPATPGQPVPDVPGAEPGEPLLVVPTQSTGETRVNAVASYRYDPTRIDDGTRVTAFGGAFRATGPYNLAALGESAWLATSGQAAGLVLSFEIERDGETRRHEIVLPWLGQALAAGQAH